MRITAEGVVTANFDTAAYPAQARALSYLMLRRRHAARPLCGGVRSQSLHEHVGQAYAGDEQAVFSPESESAQGI